MKKTFLMAVVGIISLACSKDDTQAQDYEWLTSNDQLSGKWKLIAKYQYSPYEPQPTENIANDCDLQYGSATFGTKAILGYGKTDTQCYKYAPSYDHWYIDGGGLEIQNEGSPTTHLLKARLKGNHLRLAEIASLINGEYKAKDIKYVFTYEYVKQ